MVLLGRYIPREAKEVIQECEFDGKSPHLVMWRNPLLATVVVEVNSSPDSRLCKLMRGDESKRKGSGGEQHSEGKVVHLQDNVGK